MPLTRDTHRVGQRAVVSCELPWTVIQTAAIFMQQVICSTSSSISRSSTCTSFFFAAEDLHNVDSRTSPTDKSPWAQPDHHSSRSYSVSRAPWHPSQRHFSKSIRTMNRKPTFLSIAAIDLLDVSLFTRNRTKMSCVRKSENYSD